MTTALTARLADIAVQAEVSEATASRVLNGRPGVAGGGDPAAGAGRRRRARLRAPGAGPAAQRGAGGAGHPGADQSDLPRVRPGHRTVAVRVRVHAGARDPDAAGRRHRGRAGRSARGAGRLRDHLPLRAARRPDGRSFPLCPAGGPRGAVRTDQRVQRRDQRAVRLPGRRGGRRDGRRASAPAGPRAHRAGRRPGAVRPHPGARRPASPAPWSAAGPSRRSGTPSSPSRADTRRPARCWTRAVRASCAAATRWPWGRYEPPGSGGWRYRGGGVGGRLRRLRVQRLHRSAAHHRPPAGPGDGQRRGARALLEPMGGSPMADTEFVFQPELVVRGSTAHAPPAADRCGRPPAGGL